MTESLEQLEISEEQSIQNEELSNSEETDQTNSSELSEESNELTTTNKIPSEELNDQFEMADDHFNQYSFKEASLNRNQTCENATDYNRRVEGGMNNENSLKQGDGIELIEGEEGNGEISGLSRINSAELPKYNADCKKLLNLLRAILDSNTSNKYKGDFKSGKKLNLKKIVPHIASDYKIDRIWKRIHIKDNH